MDAYLSSSQTLSSIGTQTDLDSLWYKAYFPCSFLYHFYAFSNPETVLLVKLFLVIVHIAVKYFHFLFADVEYVHLGDFFTLLAFGLLTVAVALHIGLGTVSYDASLSPSPWPSLGTFVLL